MAKFGSDFISGIFHPDGIRFKLIDPISYQTDINPESFGYTIEYLRKDKNGLLWIDIPSGFVTDFASSPQFLWSIVPSIGRHSRASIVHDFIYGYNKEGKPWADKVFFEAMTVDKTSTFVKYACYYAVRLMGRKAWDACTKDKGKDIIKDKNWLN